MATDAVDIPEGLEELFEQSWFDLVLHYGLLVGAIFQLICIAAIVVLPPTPEETQEEGGSEGGLDGDSVERSGTGKGDDSGRTGGGMAGSSSKKGGQKKARKRK